MASIRERQKWQAQEDAYTMAKFNEITADKARMARAVKAAKTQATQMQQQANDMQRVAKGMTKVARTKVATSKKK